MVVQHSVKLTVKSMIEPLALTPSLGFTQKDGVNNMFFFINLFALLFISNFEINELEYCWVKHSSYGHLYNILVN